MSLLSQIAERKRAAQAQVLAQTASRNHPGNNQATLGRPLTLHSDNADFIQSTAAWLASLQQQPTLTNHGSQPQQQPAALAVPGGSTSLLAAAIQARQRNTQQPNAQRTNNYSDESTWSSPRTPRVDFTSPREHPLASPRATNASVSTRGSSACGSANDTVDKEDRLSPRSDGPPPIDYGPPELPSMPIFESCVRSQQQARALHLAAAAKAQPLSAVVAQGDPATTRAFAAGSDALRTASGTSSLRASIAALRGRIDPTTTLSLAAGSPLPSTGYPRSTGSITSSISSSGKSSSEPTASRNSNGARLPTLLTSHQAGLCRLLKKLRQACCQMAKNSRDQDSLLFAPPLRLRISLELISSNTFGIGVHSDASLWLQQVGSVDEPSATASVRHAQSPLPATLAQVLEPFLSFAPRNETMYLSSELEKCSLPLPSIPRHTLVQPVLSAGRTSTSSGGLLSEIAARRQLPRTPSGASTDARVEVNHSAETNTEAIMLEVLRRASVCDILECALTMRIVAALRLLDRTTDHSDEGVGSEHLLEFLSEEDNALCQALKTDPILAKFRTVAEIRDNFTQLNLNRPIVQSQESAFPARSTHPLECSISGYERVERALSLMLSHMYTTVHLGSSIGATPMLTPANSKGNAVTATASLFSRDTRALFLELVSRAWLPERTQPPAAAMLTTPNELIAQQLECQRILSIGARITYLSLTLLELPPMWVFRILAVTTLSLHRINQALERSRKIQAMKSNFPRTKLHDEVYSDATEADDDLTPNSEASSISSDDEEEQQLQTKRIRKSVMQIGLLDNPNAPAAASAPRSRFRRTRRKMHVLSIAKIHTQLLNKARNMLLRLTNSGQKSLQHPSAMLNSGLSQSQRIARARRTAQRMRMAQLQSTSQSTAPYVQTKAIDPGMNGSVQKQQTAASMHLSISLDPITRLVLDAVRLPPQLYVFRTQLCLQAYTEVLKYIQIPSGIDETWIRPISTYKVKAWIEDLVSSKLSGQSQLHDSARYLTAIRESLSPGPQLRKLHDGRDTGSCDDIDETCIFNDSEVNDILPFYADSDPWISSTTRLRAGFEKELVEGDELPTNILWPHISIRDVPDPEVDPSEIEMLRRWVSYQRMHGKSVEACNAGTQHQLTLPPGSKLKNVPDTTLSLLLPHQIDAISFVVARQGQCILADEMGLGKTLQAIVIAGIYKADWPLLVICPSSLRFMWELELKSRLGLSADEVHVIMSSSDTVAECICRRTTATQVVITSYDLCVSMCERLKECLFGMTIVDECHAIKTPLAKRTRAVVELCHRARRRLLLTATPALSRPFEMYTQLYAVQPYLFPSLQRFGEEYCLSASMAKFSQNRHQGDVRGDYSPSDAWMQFRGQHKHLQLKYLLNKYVLLRRLKRDVLADLPPKTRRVVLLSNYSMQTSNKTTSLSTRGDTYQCHGPSGSNRSIPLEIHSSSEARAVMAHASMLPIGLDSLAKLTLPQDTGEIDSRTARMIRKELRRAWLEHEFGGCDSESHQETGKDEDVSEALDDDDTDEDVDGQVCPTTLSEDLGINWLWSASSNSDSATQECAQDQQGDLAQERDESKEEDEQVRNDDSAPPGFSLAQHVPESVVQSTDFQSDEDDSQPPTKNTISKRKIEGVSMKATMRMLGIDPQDKSDATDVSGVTASGSAGIHLSPTGSPHMGSETVMRLFERTARAKIPHSVAYMLYFLSQGLAKQTDPQSPPPKLIVFAHHKAMLDALESALNEWEPNSAYWRSIVWQLSESSETDTDAKEKSSGDNLSRNLTYIRIDGSTKPEDRQRQAAAFQASMRCCIALLSITAAGTGLTLTSCQEVVFTELTWTPALLLQAEDRVHRIGQTLPCRITYLISLNSLDQVMWRMLLRKIRVVERALGDEDHQGSANILQVEAPECIPAELVDKWKGRNL